MSGAPLRGRTILIIEDDADQREVLQRQLEALGAHIVVAADGLEGLGQLERWRPDAVLCDLKMPTMDGLEFARRMRQLPQHRQVLLVAVTGWARQPDVFHTWNTGFDGHLIKPITLEALNAIAERLAGPDDLNAAGK